MKKSPETTIVITCFNYGRFLEGCLNSALRQSYDDVEIIVVDDGSTDNTAEIMKKYAKQQKVVYVRQNNSGQAKAKNAGIKLAKGKYIAFLDADDLWEVAKLEKQLPSFSSKRIGVTYSRARYIDGEGRDLDFHLAGKYLQPRRGKVSSFLLMDNFIPFSSSVIRRECIEEFGGFDENLKMGIDWDLWLRMSTRYEFDFVDEALLIYRIGHPGQMSKNVTERQRCSDRILTNFIGQFPGHVTKVDLRRAWAYTYVNRGAYLSKSKFSEALRCYWRSFLQWPFSLDPVIGVLKILRDNVF